MITVEEAFAFANGFNPRKTVELRALKDSLGNVITSKVVSPINMPPFPQSAMDGYALGAGELVQGSTFKVIGEVAAGNSERFQVNENECVRIFTGAPVPESAQSVVQQEWVERESDQIQLTRDVAVQMHIRPMGEQMKTSEVALNEGTFITPATVGFLSMLGITEVSVYRKPSVQILVTGNELADPGTDLHYGQIFESNSTMLVSAMEKEGISATSIRVPDDLTRTIEVISEALESNDMVVISGGISVGDHDHVGPALQQIGAEEIFYKVKQKPGKPLYFGTKNDKPIFALPGNPAASLTCFYMYVQPMLRRMYGHPQPELIKADLAIEDDFTLKADRAVFLKALANDRTVKILPDQSSAMLSSFASANALVYLDGRNPTMKAGDSVPTYLLNV